jgi:GTP-binding protein Era
MNENNYKSGFISIVGRPNVGKSTLINSILGEKFAIISNKPQTTRNTIRCIYTTNETQMVFLDTPGIHKPKNKLGSYMVNLAMDTLSDVDLVLYVMDESKTIGPGDKYILDKLSLINTPIFVVINKIDLIPKELLLQKIDQLKDYNYISEIIPVSAVKNEGVDYLLDNINNYLPYGPEYFPEDMVIDRAERWLVQELIREKALQLLKEEIPHGIAIEVTSMKPRNDKNIIDIEANIYCERKSHKGIVIGKNGNMLKKIGSLARRDIEKLLGSKVNLQLWIKVRPNWRDKNFDLKDLGYYEQE